MEGKNMSLTPYHFTSNNPVMRIDPDGLNDYFSEDGVFLGSDDSKDDGIRILSTEAWNTLSQEDEEGNEYIDKASGLSASLLASESDLSTDAILSIYQHYNPTDLLLADSKNITKGGFEFIPSFNGNDPYLRVHVETNSTLKLIDHSSEIISGLIHEKQHYSDYVEMGAVDYFRLPKNFREVRAYNSQTTHESWNNTRSEFQRNVLTNAVPFGFHLPIILPRKGVVFPEVELN
ncbi:hypothetical protein GCM10011318_11780 [Phaeocystidibacter marisrubri]|nr:hypothetical protein GCM10011318_11780 [Phaeocystidibacter marisrubri]